MVGLVTGYEEENEGNRESEGIKREEELVYANGEQHLNEEHPY